MDCRVQVDDVWRSSLGVKMSRQPLEKTKEAVRAGSDLLLMISSDRRIVDLFHITSKQNSFSDNTPKHQNHFSHTRNNDHNKSYHGTCGARTAASNSPFEFHYFTHVRVKLVE